MNAKIKCIFLVDKQAKVFKLLDLKEREKIYYNSVYLPLSPRQS